MKKPNNLKKLAVAVSLLSGSHAALALTPWTDGTPDFTVYTSGGAAQDKAVAAAVSSVLAASGSLDTFQDTVVSSQRVNGTLTNITTNGGAFTAYYFTGSSTLSDTALRGKKILFVKRSLGAAGYGVIPLLENASIDNLNIQGTASTDWSNSGKTHLATIDHAHAGKYLTQVPSHGGLIGVDAPALLQAGYNYAQPVTEVSTNAPTTPWATNYTPASLAAAGITRVATGGEIYGIAVTTDLYKVLQAAQIADGSLTLPTGHSIGSYASDGDLPSLSRNFVASLLAGKVQLWDNVEVNVSGTTTSLTSFAGAAGVTAPANTVVAVGLRNTGAAVGAVAYAKFLGYPYVAGASIPPAPTPNTSSDEYNAAPIIKGPNGTSDTDNLLNDWQYGDNTTGYNNVPASTSGDASPYVQEHLWGLAIQTADRNTNGALGYRYIKIDGAAPTLANVGAGTYPDWAEGEVLISSHATASESLFLTDFAKALAAPATATAIDGGFTQPYGGIPGIFATSANTGTAVSVPTSLSNPVVPYTHNVGGHTSIGIVPYAYDGSGAGAPTILLK